MKKVGVALLGVGTVGGGTYNILKQKKDYFKQTQNLDVEVMHVLERNLDRTRELGISDDIVSCDIDNVINNKDISIVCEFFGGIEPARTFLIKALEAGKSIVTANKELFSKHWPELQEAAKKGNAGLYFEASCVGGVPIIRTITEGMQANKITCMQGIINGTTNYILSNMSDNGVSYEDALKEAQKLGYAEANPTADVDGFDAMYKISILSTLAYHKRVPISRVYREGMTNIKSEDINYGKELGYTLKLLAISKNIDGKIEARVHPTFVKNNNPLATVKGSFNAVLLNGDSVGDIMLYGRGAGDFPTGSAIVSDIIYAAQRTEPYTYIIEETTDEDFNNDFFCRYYLRLSVLDVAGNFATIADVLGKNNVSIRQVVQKHSDDDRETVPVIIVTHETKESDIQKAIAELVEKNNCVMNVEALIRVAQ